MSLYYITGVPVVKQNSAAIINTGDSNPNVKKVLYSREILPTGNYPVLSDDVTVADINYGISRKHNRSINQRSSDNLASQPVLRNASIYPQYVNSINYAESNRTALKSTAIRAGEYNMSTGKFSLGYPAVSNDAFGQDNAARSSFDSPGSISFRVGNTITTQNYEAKG